MFDKTVPNPTHTRPKEVDKSTNAVLHFLLSYTFVLFLEKFDTEQVGIPAPVRGHVNGIVNEVHGF